MTHDTPEHESAPEHFAPVPLEPPLPPPPQKPVARLILAAFVLTFMSSRVVVILIMSRVLPDFFFHLGQTHVHHLNYGIFLLSGVGAYLLMRRPTGHALAISAVLYGMGLALTFDEFGMWLHLGGSYWQRASFDAIVVITALLGLFSVAPALRRLHKWQWTLTVVVAGATLLFTVALVKSVERFAGHPFSKWLHQIETSGPQ